MAIQTVATTVDECAAADFSSRKPIGEEELEAAKQYTCRLCAQSNFTTPCTPDVAGYVDCPGEEASVYILISPSTLHLPHGLIATLTFVLSSQHLSAYIVRSCLDSFTNLRSLHRNDWPQQHLRRGPWKHPHWAAVSDAVDRQQRLALASRSAHPQEMLLFDEKD